MNSIKDKEVTSFVSEVIMEETPLLEKNILKDCILKLHRNRMRLVKEKLIEEIKSAEEKNDRERLKNLIVKFNKINSGVRNG